MIQIIDKSKCCGCTACFCKCPKKAIIMKRDKEGFLYPNINLNKCIDCGLCEKVCPILNKPLCKEENTKGYIVRNRKVDIVKDSTSGGAFTAICTLFIDKGGIIYGAGYNDNMQVICKKTNSSKGLEEMRGSKFVQSKLGNTFLEIKKELSENKMVVFSGTPCQVNGLITFLGKKPKNLFCIDFVCRGVPSPGLWDNYISYMQKKYNSNIVDVKFKNKTYGYHASTMRVKFKNGKIWCGSGRIDPMMKAFVNELASRPSCEKCQFKTINRVSDITMFDCYNFSKIINEKDDDKGYTSLLIHTAFGEKVLIDIAENLQIFEADVEKLVKYNGIMVCHSAKANPKRNEFYRLTTQMSINDAMNKILPITIKDRIIEHSKKFLCQTKLIRIVKKIKKEEIRLNEHK